MGGFVLSYVCKIGVMVLWLWEVGLVFFGSFFFLRGLGDTVFDFDIL